MMNILFDPQVFSFQEYGGISQYYYQLFKEFTKMEGIKPELIIKFSNNSYLADLDFTNVKHFSKSYRFKGRNDIIRLLNQAYFKKYFSAMPRPDVFHPTYYNPYFLDIIEDIPFVLTIYDMSHELYPDSFSKYDFASMNKSKTALRASRIIAISENTKKDIIRILQIPESKIDVTPLATDLSLDKIKAPSASLPEHFILYVGKRNTYKNFFFLLNAFAMVQKMKNEYSLLCAGGGIFTKQEVAEIDRLKLPDKVIQIKATDDELAYLFSKAKAFVYPSLYEGFGIPVLEAFACGCPAILSNRSSLPEVGGEAAQYFDPENTESLINKLTGVLENENLASTMRMKGLERVKLFSWKQTARKTLETYKKIVRP
jgi:glycosyltransferase involved in cell wall biosynthesis